MNNFNNLPVKRITFYSICIVIVLFVFFAVFFFVGRMGGVFTPFFIAIALTYLLNPVVKKLEHLGIQKKVGILLAYFGLLSFFTMIVIYVIPIVITNVKELIISIPKITEDYQKISSGILDTLKYSTWPEEVRSAVNNEIQNGILWLNNTITQGLKKSIMSLVSLITFFFEGILALFLAYYFMVEPTFFSSGVLYLSPKKWRKSLINIGREINNIFANFIQGQLITALIIGVLETSVLGLLHVKFFIVLGIIGGISNMIPYFGPIIGAAPAVIIALAQSPTKALWTILVFIVVQQIDASFISSKIIEKRIGLHPITTILVILIGGEFFGIIGMLLAVPIAAILKVIIKRAIDTVV